SVSVWLCHHVFWGFFVGGWWWWKKPSEQLFHENTHLLPAENGEKVTRLFLRELLNILLAYINKSQNRSSKVLDFHYPHQLKEGREGFSLELPDQPENLEQLLVDCRDTLKYGVKTGHPRFFNQLSTGLDIIGLAGEWLTSTANTNMFTYEVAPVFILMEEVILKKMQTFIGWSEEEGDGIFSPGGTMSNLYSVLLARYHFFPHVKTEGMHALPRLALFTSAHSHYSIKKSAVTLGIGSENVFLLKNPVLSPQGLFPFYVNTTAGTTVYGAFDPISDIADICENHGLWLHVDGAWGGGLLLSERHRTKLRGIERASSVTWNPHKMMCVPLQCSAILVRKKGLLQKCNQLSAEYLFQMDKHYDTSYDTGDKTIQCGRHVDVFKLWLMWKAKVVHSTHPSTKPSAAYGNILQHIPEHSNVCFWYLPTTTVLRRLKGSVHVSKVAPKIKAKMMESGATMVGYQPLGDKVNFFRCVFSNPATQKADVDFLVDEIARLGSNLSHLKYEPNQGV
uniref:Glutamate decarboxylase 3 n=1 Tax=Electrophorus electricus TaxID=8005 RepID=A0A4W4DMR9_ELEEL